MEKHVLHACVARRKDKLKPSCWVAEMLRREHGCGGSVWHGGGGSRAWPLKNRSVGRL